MAARLTGARLVHTEHSNLFAHQARLITAERALARLTDAVVADSEKVRRGLIAQGLPAHRIRTIVNGIDTERLGRDGLSGRKRTELALYGTSIIGTVGRLVPVKDQATLLAAFAAVREAFPGVTLVLVGDGPERSALECQAHALGIRPHVRFLGERTDVAELVHLFDVFVLSSVSEGMPLTVLEAMAAGRPVVATNVGGLPEVVEHGATGLLVPAGDPRAMAEAIAKLLREPGVRARMGEAGRQRARSLFDVQHMVQAYETAYRH